MARVWHLLAIQGLLFLCLLPRFEASSKPFPMAASDKDQATLVHGWYSAVATGIADVTWAEASEPQGLGPTQQFLTPLPWPPPP